MKPKKLYIKRELLSEDKQYMEGTCWTLGKDSKLWFWSAERTDENNFNLDIRETGVQCGAHWCLNEQIDCSFTVNNIKYFLENRLV